MLAYVFWHRPYPHVDTALIRALSRNSGRAGLARSLASAPPVPRAAVHDEVAAVYQRDPRTLNPGELRRLCREASARVAALGPEIAFNAVAALSELREELFLSSDGTQVQATVVAWQVYALTRDPLSRYGT